MKAWCLIRDYPHYRRQAFVAGLAAAGYRVVAGEPAQDIAPDDVLVIWNRYSHWEQMAARFEKRGGRVVVVENGYLGSNGSTPKFDVAGGAVRPEHYYALAIGGHNGEGTWPADDGSRWRALGIEIKPWRTGIPSPLTGEGEGGGEADNRHILVCPQRGIGPRNYAQPQGWPEDVCRRLRAATARSVRIRPHPGLGPGSVPIAQDLQDCWAVVTWASGAGIHALLAGVPVFAEAPAWILLDAAERDISAIEQPACRERLPAFQRLACAQATVAEIESGEAFRRLLTGAVWDGKKR